MLVDQVERFARAGQMPVAAVELEFYVTGRTTNSASVLDKTEGLSADARGPRTFGFEEMDALWNEAKLRENAPRKRARA